MIIRWIAILSLICAEAREEAEYSSSYIGPTSGEEHFEELGQQSSKPEFVDPEFYLPSEVESLEGLGELQQEPEQESEQESEEEAEEESEQEVVPTAGTETTHSPVAAGPNENPEPPVISATRFFFPVSQTNVEGREETGSLGYDLPTSEEPGTSSSTYVLRIKSPVPEMYSSPASSSEETAESEGSGISSSPSGFSEVLTPLVGAVKEHISEVPEAISEAEGGQSEEEADAEAQLVRLGNLFASMRAFSPIGLHRLVESNLDTAAKLGGIDEDLEKAAALQSEMAAREQAAADENVVQLEEKHQDGVEPCCGLLYMIHNHRFLNHPAQTKNLLELFLKSEAFENLTEDDAQMSEIMGGDTDIGIGVWLDLHAWIEDCDKRLDKVRMARLKLAVSRTWRQSAKNIGFLATMTEGTDFKELFGLKGYRPKNVLSSLINWILIMRSACHDGIDGYTKLKLSSRIMKYKKLFGGQLSAEYIIHSTPHFFGKFWANNTLGVLGHPLHDYVRNGNNIRWIEFVQQYKTRRIDAPDLTIKDIDELMSRNHVELTRFCSIMKKKDLTKSFGNIYPLLGSIHSDFKNIGQVLLELGSFVLATREATMSRMERLWMTLAVRPWLSAVDMFSRIGPGTAKSLRLS